MQQAAHRRSSRRRHWTGPADFGWPWHRGLLIVREEAEAGVARRYWSRRDMIGAALSAAGLAVTGAPASARQKVSQAAAHYQDRPKHGFSCAACALFRPSGSCTVVAGAISPHGWCRFFDLPD